MLTPAIYSSDTCHASILKLSTRRQSTHSHDSCIYNHFPETFPLDILSARDSRSSCTEKPRLHCITQMCMLLDFMHLLPVHQQNNQQSGAHQTLHLVLSRKLERRIGPSRIHEFPIIIRTNVSFQFVCTECTWLGKNVQKTRYSCND